MSLLHRLRYFVVHALRAMRAAPLVHAVAVSTIGVAVVVLGAFVVVLLTVDRVAQDWGQEVRLIAFLSQDVEAESLAGIAAQIRPWPEVADVDTRTREMAYTEFRDSLGPDRAILDGHGPDIMPASVEVAMAEGHRAPATLAAVAARLRSVPGLEQVEEVAYGRELLMRLEGFRDLLRIAGVAVGGLVLFGVIFIVSNTVRLALYARRDEIEIMQLVGATAALIRGPYYVEGALQGAFGAAAGLGLLFSLHQWIVPRSAEIFAFALGETRFEFLAPEIMGAIVAGASAIALLASHVSVTRFLRPRAPLSES